MVMLQERLRPGVKINLPLTEVQRVVEVLRLARVECTKPRPAFKVAAYSMVFEQGDRKIRLYLDERTGTGTIKVTRR